MFLFLHSSQLSLNSADCGIHHAVLGFTIVLSQLLYIFKVLVPFLSYQHIEITSSKIQTNFFLHNFVLYQVDFSILLLEVCFHLLVLTSNNPFPICMFQDAKLFKLPCPMHSAGDVFLEKATFTSLSRRPSTKALHKLCLWQLCPLQWS